MDNIPQAEDLKQMFFYLFAWGSGLTLFLAFAILLRSMLDYYTGSGNEEKMWPAAKKILLKTPTLIIVSMILSLIAFVLKD